MSKQIDSGSLMPYIRFRTSRSGGSGGQHVNKVETRVTLSFDVDAAGIFSDEEKARIKTRLQNRLQADGAVQVNSQEARSQLENKEIALKKLVTLLRLALQPIKPRKATKPSKASVRARLETKRKRALRKIDRRKDWE
ncbi:alternative ribosome rescue aminoacyl-tRNA hydrolase ArfB [Parapedobacter lycopersici]|uniref:alternative ribosome rescue aminoacyl-tRNA hydrolase ArfB n=1 Tax=Parapedobacter lycopersici TaxID=1864939 RepID=UPI00214D3AF8|nr:alternative ribosome rescue aminoacyl-tRNA hydrolase ArfB [Parapedobacter lycopersici]